MRQFTQQALLDVGKNSLGEILTSSFFGRKHSISSPYQPFYGAGLLSFLGSPDFTQRH